MSLLICKECKKEISSSAKKCPSCGNDRRNWFMKHKIITFIAALALIGIFGAIAGSMQDNSNNSIVVTNSEVNNIKPEAPLKEILISEGDVIKNDNLEITIKNIEFSYDVIPENTSSFYTHYQAENGKVYIHIDTDVKNLAKQNLDCDDIMLVTANYNNGYTYSSFAVPEDESTGFTYANITSIDPLETLGVRFLINCPQEVEETENPLYLTLKLSSEKQTYKYVLRN